jgi:hypothetical protein
MRPGWSNTGCDPGHALSARRCLHPVAVLPKPGLKRAVAGVPINAKLKACAGDVLALGAAYIKLDKRCASILR